MGSASQSAVIRARYSNDVSGINRYKHFHSPMQLPLTLLALSPTINNNIDGKYSPPGSSNSLLPRISPIPLRRSTGRKNVVVQSAKPQNTTRRKPQKSNNNINNSFNNGKLPQLSSNSSPVLPLNITGIKKPLSKRQSKSSSNSGSVTKPHVTLLTLPTLDTSATFLIQSAPTTVLQNVINTEKLPRLSRSFSANQLPKAPKPAAKDNKIAPKKSSPTSKETQTKVIRQKHNVPSKLSVPKGSSKTCGTQTENFHYLEKSKSISSVGTGELFIDLEVVQRSTQTDQILYLENDEKNLTDSTVVHKMEERSKLYEIIDNALDETIDRNSRMRANKLIASTAKQQAEVWRDAKEFVTKILLPSSISLANQSRSSQSPRSPLQRIIQNWDQKF